MTEKRYRAMTPAEVSIDATQKPYELLSDYDDAVEFEEWLQERIDQDGWVVKRHIK